jgi:uncharacterized protein (TIGR01244 family)
MGRLTFAGVALMLAGTLAAAGQARKEPFEGVRNFTVVDATVACAGATEVEAIPRIHARGYRAIVNLRLPTETGAAIDASRAAATAAGLAFIHLPLDGAAPQASTLDAFIKAVTDPAHQPVFVNCGSANRVGAVWLAKRMLVDGWEEARALEEAAMIGLTSEALRTFALAYVAERRR